MLVFKHSVHFTGEDVDAQAKHSSCLTLSSISSDKHDTQAAGFGEFAQAGQFFSCEEQAPEPLETPFPKSEGASWRNRPK